MPPTQLRPEIDDTTKLSARLPRINLEMMHTRSPAGDSERLTITIEATPSFGAFADHLEAGNPFAHWYQAMQLAWLPWIAVQRALLAPIAMLGEFGSERNR